METSIDLFNAKKTLQQLKDEFMKKTIELEELLASTRALASEKKMTFNFELAKIRIKAFHEFINNNLVHFDMNNKNDLQLYVEEVEMLNTVKSDLQGIRLKIYIQTKQLFDLYNSTFSKIMQKFIEIDKIVDALDDIQGKPKICIVVLKSIKTSVQKNRANFVEFEDVQKNIEFCKQDNFENEDFQRESVLESIENKTYNTILSQELIAKMTTSLGAELNFELLRLQNVTDFLIINQLFKNIAESQVESQMSETNEILQTYEGKNVSLRVYVPKSWENFRIFTKSEFHELSTFGWLSSVFSSFKQVNFSINELSREIPLVLQSLTKLMRKFDSISVAHFDEKSFMSTFKVDMSTLIHKLNQIFPKCITAENYIQQEQKIQTPVVQEQPITSEKLSDLSASSETPEVTGGVTGGNEKTSPKTPKVMSEFVVSENAHTDTKPEDSSIPPSVPIQLPISHMDRAKLLSLIGVAGISLSLMLNYAYKRLKHYYTKRKMWSKLDLITPKPMWILIQPFSSETHSPIRVSKIKPDNMFPYDVIYDVITSVLNIPNDAIVLKQTNFAKKNSIITPTFGFQTNMTVDLLPEIRNLLIVELKREGLVTEDLLNLSKKETNFYMRHDKIYIPVLV